MMSITKATTSLKLIQSSKAQAVRKLLNPCKSQAAIFSKKLNLTSETRQIGDKEKSLIKEQSEETSTKIGSSDNQNVDTRDSISGDHRGRNLSIGDKVVLFLFSEKGKYNRISDIPDRVALSEFRRAYDMQRIIGCSVTMIILGLVVYFGIRRTKRQISESPIHGELLDSTIDGFGHNVGQPRPARNTARREYREGT